jgi:Bacterial Ig domain
LTRHKIDQKINHLTNKFLDLVLQYRPLRRRPILTLSCFTAVLALLTSWLLYSFPSSLTLNPFAAGIVGNSSLIILEPENGSLTSPMTASTDPTASNNKYISSTVANLTAPSVSTSGPSPCQFQKADQPLNVALCETFDAPAGTGNRSGQLNGTLWGVSRVTSYKNDGQGVFYGWWPSKQLQCGASVLVKPENDVNICGGRMLESVNDGGMPNSLPGNGAATLFAAYPKQPFDIAGRTGTVTFDASSDSINAHQAWIQFAYTDQPIPAPHGNSGGGTAGVPGIQDYARNGFGFAMSTIDQTPCQHVTLFYVVRNYVLQNPDITDLGCVNPPAQAGPLNHFEVRISQNQVDVYGTDPGSTVLKHLAVLSNANLTLTRGLIWIEDAHYNACKDFGVQCDHTFAWDNVGFDGPVLPRDLAYDALDNLKAVGDGSLQLGWLADSSGTSVQIPNVSGIGQATGALLTFNNIFSYNTLSTNPSLLYRLNGNAWHTEAWPFPDNSNEVTRPFAIPIPLSEIQSGTNTVEFKAPDVNTVIANADIILIAAGGVHPPVGQPVSTNTSGSSFMSFNAPQAGTYSVWTRMMATDTNSDSYWLQVDNQTPINVGDGGVPFGSWTWVNHQNGNTSQQVQVNLTAGSHTLTVYGREANVKVDSLLITPDLSFNPNTLPIIDTTPPTAVINSPANGATVSGVVPVSVTATDNAAVSKVELIVDGSVVASSSTNQNNVYSLSWDTSGISGAAHSMMARATDTSGNVGTSSIINVNVPQSTTPPPPPPAPSPSPSPSPSPAPSPSPSPAPSPVTIDKTVSKHQAAFANSISSPAFSTTHAGDLLVAFITSDGPQVPQSFSSVSGGGLVWTLRARSNAQPGTAEIWQAVAPKIMTNMTVTARRTIAGYPGMMTVLAFTGANLTSSGATNIASSTSGTPVVPVTTTTNNSWVWGVGNDWDNPINRTAASGQTVVDQYLSSSNDTYWTQKLNSVTPKAGTVVKLQDTAPTTDRWDFAGIEIRP